MLMLLNIFSFALICGTAKSQGFSYEDPTTWGGQYPTCNGNNQSPVDIPWNIADFVLLQDGLLQWNNYDNIADFMRVVNNGHTIQISPTWANPLDRPYLTGGPLDGEYVIEQFHFHWGQNDSVGSEHTFNGTKTAMEFHMVHWKRNYGSLEAAVGNADGLAVIGALYDPIYATSSNGIEQIWSLFGDLQQDNSETQVEPFPLTDFEVVHSGETFASYHGSLTTPGCEEVATWLVALDLFSITSDELQQIRSIRLSNDDDHNYRPVQKLNVRTFSYYRSN